MQILVYDIAAEDAGGLYVLKQFYSEIAESLETTQNDNPGGKTIEDNQDIDWFILTSLNIFEEKKHLHILYHPEVKASIKQRLKFDFIDIKKVIKQVKPDAIISLQNNAVVGTDIPQYVYLHQSLQYCPKRYSLFNKEERSTAIRQKFICGFYKHTLPKAKHIFVQTNWMKDATAKWLPCDSKSITVIPMKAPIVPINANAQQNKSEVIQFFYPARPESYKNHVVIIDACKKLLEEGIASFKVLFTFKENENEYAKRIAEQADGLPIQFLGTVQYQDIWNYYRNSVLVFPSFMETVGLPMLEAKAVGGKILASDLPFSHENLDGYNFVDFFDYKDSEQLSCLMKKHITNSIDYQNCSTVFERKNRKLNCNIMQNIVKRILEN